MAIILKRSVSSNEGKCRRWLPRHQVRGTEQENGRCEPHQQEVLEAMGRAEAWRMATALQRSVEDEVTRNEAWRWWQKLNESLEFMAASIDARWTATAIKGSFDVNGG